MKFIFPVGLAILSLIGCAGPKAPPQILNAIHENRVASIACLPVKKILYSQLVYKVLYNETVTSTSDFTGLWDIDSALSKQWSEILDHLKIKNQVLSELISTESLNALCRDCPRGKTKKANLPKEIQKVLLENHISNLLLLRFGLPYLLSTTMIPSGSIHLIGDLRFLNVQTNKEDFSEQINLTTQPHYGSSPKNIEANDLLIFKSSIRDMMENGETKVFKPIFQIEK